MKKSFAYLVAALLLILSLAGCAYDGRDNTALVSPVPTAMPSASPYASPNTNDGVVKDRDGVIEDRDTGGVNDDNNGNIVDNDRNGAGIIDDDVNGTGVNGGNGNNATATTSPSPTAKNNGSK